LWSEQSSRPPNRQQSGSRQQQQFSEGPNVPAEVASDAAGEPVLLLTIQGAGRALGVGRSTIYQLVQQGDLEVVHIGRAARIPVDAVHDYVRRLRRG
jgi:excisionase family DNA binding protein